MWGGSMWALTSLATSKDLKIAKHAYRVVNRDGTHAITKWRAYIWRRAERRSFVEKTPSFAGGWEAQPVVYTADTPEELEALIDQHQCEPTDSREARIRALVDAVEAFIEVDERTTTLVLRDAVKRLKEYL